MGLLGLGSSRARQVPSGPVHPCRGGWQARAPRLPRAWTVGLGLPGWWLWDPRRAGPLLFKASELHQEQPPGEVRTGVTCPGGTGVLTLLTRHIYVHACYRTRHTRREDWTLMIQGIKKSTTSIGPRPCPPAATEGPAPAPRVRQWERAAEGAGRPTSTRNLASKFLLVLRVPCPPGSFLAAEAPRALTR